MKHGHATAEMSALSLHDALPISVGRCPPASAECPGRGAPDRGAVAALGRCRPVAPDRSEEHTSELQSRGHLVCRLLLEKKKIIAQARPPIVQFVRIVVKHLSQEV